MVHYQGSSLGFILFFFLIVLVIQYLPLCKCWTITEKCESCVDLDKSFINGMKTTSRENFGGGNTAWEESRLGSFKYSETRLVSIMEKICADNNRHKDTCNELVEEQEELIEKWWGMKRKGTAKDLPLHTFLCINELKVCCQPLKFGSDCKPCPGIVSITKDGKKEEKACNARGTCDGAGMRTGKGTCDCDVGYEGEACTQCADDFFNARNSTDNGTLPVCEACHSACNGGCSGPNPENCTSGCSSGWEWQSSDDGAAGICADVNECANTTHPVCSDGEYCVNEPGSHECPICHVACSKCRGPEQDNCTECATGYGFHEIEGGVGKCEDVNECENQTICNNGKVCTNTPGSYTCSCPEGKHENAEGVCEEKKEEEPEPPSPPSTEESTQEEKEDKTENVKEEEAPESKHEEL